MNEIQREALTALAEIWELSPGIRLGQLMAHLGFLGENHIDKGLGYIEDDELIAVMYRHRAEMKARLDGDAQASLPPTGDTTSVSGSPTFSDSGKAV